MCPSAVPLLTMPATSWWGRQVTLPFLPILPAWPPLPIGTVAVFTGSGFMFAPSPAAAAPCRGSSSGFRGIWHPILLRQPAFLCSLLLVPPLSGLRSRRGVAAAGDTATSLSASLDSCPSPHRWLSHLGVVVPRRGGCGARLGRLPVPSRQP